ncbi:MAG TPA: hypothetical protein VMX17_04860 [Candidatus Glassbacteria bacterium]|nr:hypothetical protein [Candidatus Glassbacteria bacterium]
MNPTQKTIIFIALILFLGCGIFVPYDGTQIYKTYGYGTINIAKSNSFIGYFPIFNPPSRETLFKSFSNTKDPGFRYEYESTISIPRLLIQIIIILILTIGLVLLFADKKNMGKPAYKKE